MTKKKTLIAIGSENPVKIAAVKKALSRLFPQAAYKTMAVSSGVPAQPMTDAITRQGAYNRAYQALTSVQADIGVGLEGGVMETEVGMMSTAWVCIMNNQQIVSYGGGLHFHLPDSLAIRLRAGEELGLAMDSLLKQQNTKQKGGAVSFFTAGLVSRKEGYQRLVELAVTKLVVPELFNIVIDN